MVSNKLSDYIWDFYDGQYNNWDLLSQNYDIYDNADAEEMYFDSVFWIATKILLGYRKSSLSANLKAIAAGMRPCFLCPQARPEEQESLMWRGYEILLNPYPASDFHFTVVSKEHCAQHLGNRILDMVALANQLPEACIFYNGPKCGASAPDHMHFQIVHKDIAGNFDIKQTLYNKIAKFGQNLILTPKVNVSPFGYYLLNITNAKDIVTCYNAAINTLPKSDDDDEPMINVVVFRSGKSTRIVIIPRKAHRPSCYGDEDGKMLISPAALEMMGLFVTARQEDYDRLNESTILDIYREVGYSHEEFAEFSNRLHV